jgi:lysyl-tRNA synthetase class 2
MKRLLAAGSGAIFQISRAFRAGEAGSRHNPEFTLLEWYRPGWSYVELMDEVAALVGTVLRGARHFGHFGQRGAWHLGETRQLTVAEAFASHGGGVDVHRATAAELEKAARRLPGAEAPDLGDDRLAWLDYLASFAVEPALDGMVFLYDYPVDQAALAKVRDGEAPHPPIAERFELYLDGVELANGWTELTDPVEQRRRFEKDLAERRARGLPEVPLDERFLAALESGMPECAGVALGLDRLVMLALGAERLGDVWAFPEERA